MLAADPGIETHGSAARGCQLKSVVVAEKWVAIGRDTGNDLDMLEVGNGGMSTDEYRAHFSFWALLAAPLIAGSDVRAMTREIKSILLNREVIDIDQDPLGAQARLTKREGDIEIWVRPLAGGDAAIGIFNLRVEERELSRKCTEI